MDGRHAAQQRAPRPGPPGERVVAPAPAATVRGRGRHGPPRAQHEGAGLRGHVGRRLQRTASQARCRALRLAEAGASCQAAEAVHPHAAVAGAPATNAPPPRRPRQVAHGRRASTASARASRGKRSCRRDEPPCRGAGRSEDSPALRGAARRQIAARAGASASSARQGALAALGRRQRAYPLRLGAHRALQLHPQQLARADPQVQAGRLAGLHHAEAGVEREQRPVRLHGAGDVDGLAVAVGEVDLRGGRHEVHRRVGAGDQLREHAGLAHGAAESDGAGASAPGGGEPCLQRREAGHGALDHARLAVRGRVAVDDLAQLLPAGAGGRAVALV